MLPATENRAMHAVFKVVDLALLFGQFTHFFQSVKHADVLKIFPG
jgi:hypothetical protein